MVESDYIQSLILSFDWLYDENEPLVDWLHNNGASATSTWG